MLDSSKIDFARVFLLSVKIRLLRKLRNADSLDEVDEDISDMIEIFELQKMFEIHSQEKEIEEKLKKMGYIN